MGKKRPKVLYDFLEVLGGAERFTYEYANQVSGDVIVAGANKNVMSKLPTLNGELVSIGEYSSFPIWKSIKGMRAFEKLAPEFTEAEYCMFSGSNAPLGVHRSQADRNYYYCHTPPRFVYDLAEYYQSTLPWPQAQVVKRFAEYVKARYEPAVKAMDQVFCNSANVQKRLSQYLGVQADVIYPPINTEKFGYENSKGYYLSTARLEDYKRVEMVIDAFALMPDKTLVVASGGSEYKKLFKKSQNYRNVQLLGWVDDERMHKLISECIATIYIPIDEDFGMSPVESMAAGKPVVGVREGGVKETVLHESTGYLCPPSPSIYDVIEGVEFLTESKAKLMRRNCEQRSQFFSKKSFRNRLEELLLLGK